MYGACTSDTALVTVRRAPSFYWENEGGLGERNRFRGKRDIEGTFPNPISIVVTSRPPSMSLFPRKRFRSPSPLSFSQYPHPASPGVLCGCWAGRPSGSRPTQAHKAIAERLIQVSNVNQRLVALAVPQLLRERKSQRNAYHAQRLGATVRPQQQKLLLGR